MAKNAWLCHHRSLDPSPQVVVGLLAVGKQSHTKYMVTDMTYVELAQLLDDVFKLIALLHF